MPVPPSQAGLGEQGLATLLKLRDLVGEFEKPKFFSYKHKLCAHSRNETIGCNACVEICSAEAIASDKTRQQIKVNPNLCVGCGACTTVCPSGALTYAYPPATTQGQKFKTLLSTYLQAGGAAPVLLLHSHERGQALVEEVGRAAQLGVAQGVPANVIPVAVWHTASLGIDVWLSAIAFGASQVAVLATAEEAPQYLEALREQMDVAQAILHGLGYTGTHFTLDARHGPGRSGPGAALARREPPFDSGHARALRPGPGEARHPGTRARSPGGTGADAADGHRLAGGRLAVRHRRGRQGQVHAVPELRQRLSGQRPAGQPAAAPAAFHREELRAVRAVRQHLPREGNRPASRASC